MSDRLRGLHNIVKDQRAQALEVAKQIQRLDHRLQPRYLGEEVSALSRPFFASFDAITRRAIAELEDRANRARQALRDAKRPPEGEFPFLRRKELRDRLIAMPEEQRRRFVRTCGDPEVYWAVVEHRGEPIVPWGDISALETTLFTREHEEITRCGEDTIMALQLVSGAEAEIEKLFNNAIPTDGRG